MGNAPSYLMMLLSFWLTARTRKRDENGPDDAGYGSGATGSGGVEAERKLEPEPNVLERRNRKSTAACRVCQV
jgi:hypothetical protein